MVVLVVVVDTMEEGEEQFMVIFVQVGVVHPILRIASVVLVLSAKESRRLIT